jgi:hypothetical protein
MMVQDYGVQRQPTRKIDNDYMYMTHEQMQQRDGKRAAAAQQRSRAEYLAELDKRHGLAQGTSAFFDKVNNGLIKVGDFGSSVLSLPLPGVPFATQALNQMYKWYAPPGSKYYKSK